MTAVSAVIAVRDEEHMLPACMERLERVADEIVVLVDSRSTDATFRLAEKTADRVAWGVFEDFAQFKNAAIDLAGHDWVFVADADERPSPLLRKSIRDAVAEDAPAAAFRVSVHNYFYGQEMRWGGWTSEAPVRLFRRSQARYTGSLHETLEFSVPVRQACLAGQLYHFSHRSVTDNLHKTANYADVAAAARREPATARTMVRAAGTELLRRLVVHRGYRDGTAGVVESVYQAFSAFCVEARAWELQHTPSIDSLYHQLDEELP